MYLPDAEQVVGELCRCVAPSGVLSVMALNAETLAVRPALERRWGEALAAFDARGEVGVLGTPTRADTVQGLSGVMREGGVEPLNCTACGCSRTGSTCLTRRQTYQPSLTWSCRRACATLTGS